MYVVFASISVPARRAPQFSTKTVLPITGKAIGTIGLSYKAIVVLTGSVIQSDRGCSYKVIVDKSAYPNGYEPAGGVEGGSVTYCFVTGGKL